MSDFKKIYESMLGKNDGYQIFMDFIDYVIAGFNINPHYEFKWRGKYTDEEKAKFLDLTGELVKEIQEALAAGKEYYDFLGYFYESVVQSSSKASSMGQFFTPQAVSSAMVELAVPEHEDVQSCYDCAAGSGRMLLAHHAKYPQDILTAWELDEVSAKICAINFLIHGVKGAVCCMNSLELDFYFGFKTNEMMDVTNGMPHLMDIKSEEQSRVFFGYSKKLPKPTIKKVIKKEEEVCHRPVGQTTLF